MSAFFEGMSKELDEAARIDGASEMQNLWHIVVPLAKPIIIYFLMQDSLVEGMTTGSVKG